MDNPMVSSTGFKQWKNKKDQLHRIDGPAVTYKDGRESWYINGELHRTDGPAMIYSNGEKQWFCNGRLHRTDGPAITQKDGTEYWYINGEEVPPIPSYILLWKKRLSASK